MKKHEEAFPGKSKDENSLEKWAAWLQTIVKERLGTNDAYVKLYAVPPKPERAREDTAGTQQPFARTGGEHWLINTPSLHWVIDSKRPEPVSCMLIVSHFTDNVINIIRYKDQASFEAKAAELLLRWSFISSLIMRELTLRSALSFGPFHLLRLLCTYTCVVCKNEHTKRTLL